MLGGGALEYESDVQVPTREWKKGFYQKKGGGHSVWAPRKWGLFLAWTPKNGGHSVCKNAISSQNVQILC